MTEYPLGLQLIALASQRMHLANQMVAEAGLVVQMRAWLYPASTAVVRLRRGGLRARVLGAVSTAGRRDEDREARALEKIERRLEIAHHLPSLRWLSAAAVVVTVLRVLRVADLEGVAARVADERAALEPTTG